MASARPGSGIAASPHPFGPMASRLLSLLARLVNRRRSARGRVGMPHAIAVHADEAPALWGAIDRVRRRIDGPPIESISISLDMNAAACSLPPAPPGAAGGEPQHHHLILGLPLLDALPPDEALAMLAHEYGHLVCTGEKEADAVSAALVGPAVAANALKRTGIAAMRHGEFLRTVFDAARTEPRPPADIAERWARHAAAPSSEAERARWLRLALQRSNRPGADHPPLEERLGALGAGDQAAMPPPPGAGPSAADAWLGAHGALLREQLQRHWCSRVDDSWSRRHALWQQRTHRLAHLRALQRPALHEQVEALALHAGLAPHLDHGPALQAFNAAVPDHAFGLYVEGRWRLSIGDWGGLGLLDRAIALDPATFQAACASAPTLFGSEIGQGAHGDDHAAPSPLLAQSDLSIGLEDATTADAAQQLRNPDLSAEEFAAVTRLVRIHRRGRARVWSARRVLPGQPALRSFVLGVELAAGARWRRLRAPIIEALAACEWPVPLLVCPLHGPGRPLKRQLAALGGAAISMQGS